MELKYLTTFRTIIEEGSFSAAAEKLNYTQSSITFQIGQLEKETSCKLFEKAGRQMVLSSAGKAFVPYVNQVLDAVDRLNFFHDDLTDCAGELKIGAAETFLCYRMPEVFKKIVGKYPKAKLIIRSMNCYDIRDALNDGDLDVGLFYRDIGGNMENLAMHSLCFYPVIMVASPEIAEMIPKLTKENQDYPVPFLINEKNCIFRQIFEKYLFEHNISLSHTIELESIETIKKLVQNDVGISFLPKFTVENELKDGTIKKIKTEVEHDKLTIALAYRKNKWISPLMQAFIDNVTQHNFE